MGRSMTSQELRELQLSELEILKVFKSLCEKYHLKYYLTAGTLLGAVRHGGFIPWDDDIDVAMPRDDYDRFAAICKTDLPNIFFYQSTETDPNFPYFFSKIRRNGTEVYEPHLDKVDIHKGHYIDIFPMDICPRNNILAILYFKINELLTCAYVGQIDSAFTCGYVKKYMRFLYSFFSKFSLDFLRRMRNNLALLPGKIRNTGRLCTVGGAHGYPVETYSSEWYSESVLMRFENEEYSVPKYWAEVLQNMYGNYMELPDEKSRKGHFEVINE